MLPVSRPRGSGRGLRELAGRLCVPPPYSLVLFACPCPSGEDGHPLHPFMGPLSQVLGSLASLSLGNFI